MSNSAFTPSTTTVTNNVPVNVPVVTAWENYTPTFNGFGTVTGLDARWMRVGTSLRVQIKFTSGTVPLATTARISIPSGLTIDSSAQNKILGTAATQRTTTSGTPNIALIFVETGQTTNISFTNVADGTVKNLSAIDSTTIFGNSAAQSVQFEVPIAEWAGSGTTTLATRAVEEYVSHDGTSIVRGPAGSLVPSVGFSTGVTQFIVDFQQALNATDSFVLEFSRSGLGWQNASDIYPWSAGNNASGSNFYGLRIYKFNATQYAIEFGNQGIRVAISNQSAGAESWANERIAGTRFRLRKVSSGAQVGYPVSARNIVGDTSGTSGPTGMLGELVGGTVRSGTGGFTQSLQLTGSGTWTSGTRYTMGTVTLGKGTYLVCINSSLGGFASSNSADLALFIGGTNVTPNFYYSTPAATGGSADIGLVIPVVISADNTTVLISGRSTGAGNPAINVYGEMSVVRIA